MRGARQDPHGWRTTRPTKPMTPETATAPAVSSEAPSSSLILTRETETPRWCDSLPQGQDVQFPVVGGRQGQADQGVWQQEGYVNPAPAREAPHDPEDDGRQGLLVQALDQADEGGQKGAHHDARQDAGSPCGCVPIPGQDSTAAMAAKAPTNAPRGRGLRPRKEPPTPSMTSRATPKAAPVDTPRVKGSARDQQQPLEDHRWPATSTRPESTPRDKRMSPTTTSVVRSRAGV